MRGLGLSSHQIAYIQTFAALALALNQASLTLDAKLHRESVVVAAFRCCPSSLPGCEAMNADHSQSILDFGPVGPHGP